MENTSVEDYQMKILKIKLYKSEYLGIFLLNLVESSTFFASRKANKDSFGKNNKRIN